MVEYTAKPKVAAVQAASVWLDADATIDKSIAMIAQAAANGADLIAFPETHVPGYPWWIWLGTPFWGAQFVGRFHENSLTVDGKRMLRLREAAKKNKITVVMGYSERGGASLYMSQVIIGPDGELIGNRRKLKPTHVERSVFGEGDGSDLVVFDRPFGRMGCLNCWEHYQTLTKFAMYSQHEQIHVSSWPSQSLYQPAVRTFGLKVNESAMRMYAVEGQLFVVNSSNLVDQLCLDTFCDTPEKRQLIELGGGWARFFGPDGGDLAEPLPHTEEGILYADLDLRQIPLAKAAADPVGHYARSDVLSLRFNRSKTSPVEHVGGAPSMAAAATATEGKERNSQRSLDSTLLAPEASVDSEVLKGDGRGLRN
jgi:nitrilase